LVWWKAKIIRITEEDRQMMSNIGVAKIYKISAGLWQIYWNGVT